MGKSWCSNGERVSEATIKSRLSKFYRTAFSDSEICRGCGGRAQGSAHIIPKARCKHLRHTEWIWTRWNVFPACYKCNLACETHGEDFNRLFNKEEILRILYEYDREAYHKKTLGRNEGG